MSNQSTQKECKYCQEKFSQDKIYNHQKVCNQKQRESLKINRNPEQNQIAQYQFNTSSNVSQSDKFPVQSQQPNVYGQISNQIKYDVKKFILPKNFEDKIKIFEVMDISQQQINESPIKQEVRDLSQPYINESPNKQVSQQNSGANQPEKPKEQNQFEKQQTYYKCEYCNVFIKSEDNCVHPQQCSSYIRHLEIIKDCHMENNNIKQGSNEQHIISNNINVNKNVGNNYQVKQVEQPNQQIQSNIPFQNDSQLKIKQQIISQYLTIQKDHKLLIQQGKQLMAKGIFDNIRFKATIDQKKCLICKCFFKEEEEIYLMKCCFAKQHIKCLHKHITSSILCSQCQKPIFPPPQDLKI